MIRTEKPKETHRHIQYDAVAITSRVPGWQYPSKSHLAMTRLYCQWALVMAVLGIYWLRGHNLHEHHKLTKNKEARGAVSNWIFCRKTLLWVTTYHWLQSIFLFQKEENGKLVGH